VTGGYGPGGYPGQGYDAPDYEGDPGRPRPRRQDDSVWQGDHGYAGGHDGQPGYDPQGPGYDSRGQDPRGYDPRARDPRGQDPRGRDPRDDPRGYGQPDGPPYPPPGQGSGGYHYQGTEPQPGQYGTGGAPQFDPQGAGGRGPAGGYDQRGAQPTGRNGGYGDWQQQEQQDDDSFLPGFGGRDEYGNGRVPERDGRYGYDDRRGRPDGRGAGSGGRGGRGPGGGRDDRGRDPRGRDDGPGDRGDWYDTDRRPRKKATRWIPRILVLAVVVVIVVGGLVGGLSIYHKYQARYHPADYAGPGTGDVTVQVMSGDTAFSLAPRLLQLGVIASTRAFTNAVENATSTTSATSATSTGLEVGFYQLREHMQASLAYTALTNPKNRVQTTVTIPEGKRAVDVIAIIANKTKIPLKNFQQALANPAKLGLPSYADGKVEGYLFPATYAIVPHETALQILQAMVQRFNVEAQGIGLVDAAKTVGLTPTQLVIEASLNQAEGGSVTDYPKIAEVIHNRLAIGMHLQFDSTVLYGLGKYAVSATIKQTKTPGPYNTYLNAGLPVGPISNPGDAAIQGVLHPAHGDFLYFLTKPGGKSEFSAAPLTGQ
jgi:UPF0755 protein